MGKAAVFRVFQKRSRPPFRQIDATASRRQVMGWKFWKKTAGGAEKAPKLPGPRDLPDPVGRKLVVDMGLDPDWVWSLRAAVRRRENTRHVREIRIFDPTRALSAGVRVKNFDSLDEHPGQILYAGWYNTDTGEVELTPRPSHKAA
jgi:hypothetical protein